MAIFAFAMPPRLVWANYAPAAALVDPIDGTPVDAVTEYNFNLPSLPPRNVGGQLALADPMQLTITPNTRVRIGAPQTPALLAHEQLHYDVGICIARQVARELMRLREPTVAALATAMQRIVELHFHRRSRLIQRRYDIDSQHGTNAHFQRIWAHMITAALANPNSTQIGGFFL